MPDLIGLPGDAAVEAGREVGLLVIPDPDGPAAPAGLAGTVTDQRPFAGACLEWGSFVRVWVDGRPGGGGSSGDREPHRPWPPSRTLGAEQ